MMVLVDLVIGALDVRAACSGDIKERIKLLLITIGIGLVVVIFDPF